MTKTEYLKTIADWVSINSNRIVIYGAGKFGERLFCMLEDAGIVPETFIVSDTNKNRKVVLGKEVISADSYLGNHERNREVLILIAVKPPWNEEVVDFLNYNYPEVEYLDIIPVLKELNAKTELLEITAVVGCSVACKFCPQKKLISAYSGERILSADSFKKAIDKLPQKMAIAFSGFSEPFLNPEITEMICYAGEKRREIFLNSTLVGLTREKFEKIKDVPITRFVLHLPDREQYAKIPISDEYLQILTKVLEWKQVVEGKERSVVTKANGQGSLPDVIEGIVRGKVLFHKELADRAGNLNDKELYSIGSHKGLIYCSYSPSLNNNVMMPNGDVYLCCMDFGLRHKLGNILIQDWDEIRKSDELKAVCEALSDDRKDCLCRHCTEAKQSKQQME